MRGRLIVYVLCSHGLSKGFSCLLRILPQQEESDQAIDEERGSREGGYLCPWELDGIRRSVTC